LRAFNPPCASTLFCRVRSTTTPPEATPTNGRSSAHIHTVEASQSRRQGSGIGDQGRCPNTSPRPSLLSAKQRPVAAIRQPRPEGPIDELPTLFTIVQNRDQGTGIRDQP
jgi:hypothetical protein